MHVCAPTEIHDFIRSTASSLYTYIFFFFWVCTCIFTPIRIDGNKDTGMTLEMDTRDNRWGRLFCEWLLVEDEVLGKGWFVEPSRVDVVIRIRSIFLRIL